jgi:hypothetical protein
MEAGIFQFKLIARDTLRLPPYKGSAFRGLLGHALYKTVCVTRMLDCSDCLLRANCPYVYIFDTRNERGEKVAHPYVLEPPLNERGLYTPGEELKVRLILFGRAIEYLPYLIHTFREMGNRGLGYSRGKFRLHSVQSVVNADGPLIYDDRSGRIERDYQPLDLLNLKAVEPVSRIILRFLTPLALKSDGRISREIDFVMIVNALIRRIKSLSHYHNGPLDDLLGIDRSQAEAVRITRRDMRPYRWERYSNRQKAKIDYSGLVGSLVLEGNITPYMRLLRIGEIIHIGRGTVYGMGMYSIETN